MGVPNYVYLVVAFWIIVYVSVYYVILSPKSSIAAGDAAVAVQQVDSSQLIRDLTGKDISFDANPFLSDNCANLITKYNKKSTFKRGIVVMVAHNVKKEHLVKSVCYFFCFLVLLNWFPRLSRLLHIRVRY